MKNVISCHKSNVMQIAEKFVILKYDMLIIYII